MTQLLICKDYHTYRLVCQMYGFHTNDIKFVGGPEALYGYPHTSRIFVYPSAGITVGMSECIDFLKANGLHFQYLDEKPLYYRSNIYQYVCHVCGQTIQSYFGGGITCTHPGTRFEMYGPTNIPLGQDPSRYSGVDYAYQRMPFDFPGGGPSIVDSTPCKKCSEGLLKIEFFKESKDNYCNCPEGEYLRGNIKKRIS